MDLVDQVGRSLAPAAREPFEQRVAEQASTLRTAVTDGTLDSDGFAIGLEIELYAVAADGDAAGTLAHAPDAVFETPAGKELGYHNVELNTDPTAFDDAGLQAQEQDIAARLDAARSAAAGKKRDLVCDAMWTIPPEDGSAPYLGDVTRTDDVVVAANMRPDARYCAIDNDAIRHAGGEVTFDVPGATHTFPTILFESLATSMQPHLLLPETAQLPTYYNTAIRTLGPVLALATNSPFLPADLYADADPERLLATTHHELRIAAFEQSVNQTASPKVRVPDDLDSPTDAVDAVVEDDLYAPFLREWVVDGQRETFAEDIWEFRHKRGTFWRWLRCVIGGDPVPGVCDQRSVRIEYRPLPTQPTGRDTVGLLALTAGLLHGLVRTDHPLADLDWAAAEQCFYDVAREGIDADLAWLTADGERTSDPDRIYDEVFSLARRGLADRGVDQSTIERYLRPIERRYDARTTPSVWKRNRVRAHLDAGASLPAAITEMQREYVELSRKHDTFAAWL